MPPWPRKRPQRVMLTEDVDHQGPPYVRGSTATFVWAGRRPTGPTTVTKDPPDERRMYLPRVGRKGHAEVRSTKEELEHESP